MSCAPISSNIFHTLLFSASSIVPSNRLVLNPLSWTWKRKIPIARFKTSCSSHDASAPYDNFKPATIKIGNVPWSSKNRNSANSEFTVIPGAHSLKCRTTKNICIVSPLQEEPINFNHEIVGLWKVICFQLRQIYQNMCTRVMFYKNASL